ncbi:MAG: hypothetical protein Q7S43_01480 [bacterium]|nr:hypothetical protein [bacterium]
MVHYLGGYKKGIAIDLRKKGFSYGDIKNELNIPKSTVVSWVKNIKLEENQIQKLRNKKLEAARKNSQKRVAKVLKQVEEIRTTSIKSINKISKRELWLMGIALYWRQKSSGKKESNLKNGVWFSSADPSIINLFLTWLKDVGGVTSGELYFDIFMSKDRKRYRDRLVDYWSGMTGLSSGKFKHFYYLKMKGAKESDTKGKFGFLRVRVVASSMLARQIDGWIEGIKKYYT